jgi:hypothetical protein
MSGREENNLTTITYKTLLSATFIFAFNTGFYAYYTYGYSTIPAELVGETLSILFLVSVIVDWVLTIPKIADIFYIIQNIGVTMHVKRWNSILPSNRFFSFFTKLFTLFSLCLGIYFLTLFTPISSDHCNIYSNVKHACITMQISTVFTFIALGMIGLALLLACCCCPCLCVLLNSDSSNTSNTSNTFNTNNYGTSISNRSNGIAPLERSESMRAVGGSVRSVYNSSIMQTVRRKYLPITEEPPKDSACAICYEDPKSGDKWKQLPCEHKFHPDCIDPWIREHNSCPLCRKKVLEHNEILSV